MKQLSKLASLFMFPIMVFLIHIIAARIFGLYTIFPNLDIPFHYIGGFSIAFTSVQILSHLEREKFTAPLNKLLSMVLVLSITATATVLWEFGEFIGDQVVGTNIQISLANTMQDQFMGILGGLTWIFIWYWQFLPRKTMTEK